MGLILSIKDPGAIGVIRDVAAYELPPNAWTDARNVRMENGYVIKQKGHSSVYATVQVSPYWIVPVQIGATYYWVYCGLTQTWQTDQSTHTQITKSATTYGATALIRWNGGVLNGVVIANNSVDAPQQWTGSGLMTDLSNWPASTTAKVIRPFLYHLVALDVTESGTRYPRMVRWSHPADPGSVPSSWDYTDTTKDAGRVELSETSGFCIDCLPLRDINVIYKEDSIWGMQYIGGQSVFRFFQMFKDFGVMSRDCAKEFYGKHVVLGKDDIIIHDGQTIKSIVDRKHRRWLQSKIATAESFIENAFVAINYQNSEMLFCLPESAAANGCTISLVWNWRDGSFGVRDLPGIYHANNGLVSPSSTGSQWATDTQGWADDVTTWDQLTYSNTAQKMLMAAPGSTPRLHLYDDTETFNGTAFTSYVERQGLAITGPGRVNTVTRIIPKMESTPVGRPIDIYVGSQMTTSDSIVWNGPYPFDPSTDRWVDCRVSGVYHGVRYRSDIDMTWKLNSYDVEYVPEGER